MKQLRDHKAQGSALFTLVSGIVIVIAVIYFLIKLAGSGSFGDVAETTEAATQTRIQPVGQLKLGDGIPVGERQGDQIFNGFNAMPAKGGAADLTDQELKRAITYMANKAGGTFPDPDAAAPADAAASGEAASAPAAEGAAPAEAPKADVAKADDKGVAAPAAGGADGKKVYEANCQACHGGAVPGVPHVGKKEDWAPRIKQGKDTLHKHALEGFNAMPAKGGNGSLSDDEVKAAVDYMANQSGAKF